MQVFFIKCTLTVYFRNNLTLSAVKEIFKMAGLVLEVSQTKHRLYNVIDLGIGYLSQIQQCILIMIFQYCD